MIYAFGYFEYPGDKKKSDGIKLTARISYWMSSEKLRVTVRRREACGGMPGQTAPEEVLLMKKLISGAGFFSRNHGKCSPG